MSPQSRHGRGSAGRRTRHHQDAGRHAAAGPVQQPAAAPTGTPSQEPVVEAPASPAAPLPASPAAASSLASEKRVRPAPLKKRKQHGTLYRWVAAYMPLLAVLFVLLAGVWVWTSFVSPPPPKPADRWNQIEAKWTPAREAARASLDEHFSDFTAQLADYKAFYDATKGWVDDVEAYRDWAKADTPTEKASLAVDQFVSGGREYLALLKQAYTAKTLSDFEPLQTSLPAAGNTWETNRALVRVALGLKAVAEPSVLPVPSPDCIPVASGSPAASGSPGASGSPLTSGSPGASGSPAITLPPCPAPTPTPSPAPSSTPSPS